MPALADNATFREDISSSEESSIVARWIETENLAVGILRINDNPCSADTTVTPENGHPTKGYSRWQPAEMDEAELYIRIVR